MATPSYGTAFISTVSEFVQLNTSQRAGAVILPSTFLVPGRTLTFKDIQGTFYTSSVTFSTITNSQLLEDATVRRTFNDTRGSYTFTAGSNNTWYITGGTTMLTATISSVTTLIASTFSLSTATTSVSTLKFDDTATHSTIDMYMRSTLLYFSPSSIWGGTRAGIGIPLTMRTPFLPRQISGVFLWLDAADVNTLKLSNNRVLYWNDKSASGFHFSNLSLTTSPQYMQTGFNTYYPTVSFNANYLVRSISGTPTSTYTAFIVVQGNAIPVTGGGILDAELGRFALAHSSFDGNLRPAVYNAGWTYCTNVADTNPVLYSFVCSTGGGLYINGTLNVTITTFTPIAMNGTVAIGSRFSLDSYFLNGKLSEFVLYNTTLSTVDRQKVEGYLAWKWGIVANLPNLHPYKKSLP